MKISAMILVGDNEPYLERCIQSIENCVDEIVVVLDKLEARDDVLHEKIKIINQEGTDDYAAWRNQAMEHCTGDWVLWLDADELLSFVDGTLLKKEDLAKFIMSHNNRAKTCSYDLFTLHFMYDYKTIDGRNNGDHWSHDRLIRKAAFDEESEVNNKTYKVKFVLPMHERINWLPEQMDNCHIRVPLRDNPPIIFHYGHCKGLEDVRRKYAQYMRIFPEAFEKAGIKNVDEYCAKHEVFTKQRPLIYYGGKHPKSLGLW